MRPLTEYCPKPLLEVGGEALIDSLLDRLAQAGVQKFIINAFYLAHMLESHFADKPGCEVLVESERLESGGAVVNAIQQGALTEQVFWAANSDSLWLGAESLQAMQKLWDADKMDGLLMLCPLQKANGYDGVGDFSIDSTGRLRRHGDKAQVFCGVQILNAKLFKDLEVSVFSLNKIYDEAIAKERLYGFTHKSDWWHVGTPEDLKNTEIQLAKRL